MSVFTEDKIVSVFQQFLVVLLRQLQPLLPPNCKWPVLLLHHSLQTAQQPLHPLLAQAFQLALPVALPHEQVHFPLVPHQVVDLLSLARALPPLLPQTFPQVGHQAALLFLGLVGGEGLGQGRLERPRLHVDGGVEALGSGGLFGLGLAGCFIGGKVFDRVRGEELDCLWPDVINGAKACLDVLSLVLFILGIELLHSLPLLAQDGYFLVNLIIPAVLLPELSVHLQDQVLLAEEFLDQQPPLLLQHAVIKG
jgi:hypothetical protein